MVLFGGVFLLFNNISAQEGADQADNQTITELNEKIAKQREKIEELSLKIEGHKKNIEYTRKQASTYENQLIIIQNQIARAELDIEAKEEEITSVELEIERVELEIKAKEELIDQDKVKLAAFIRTLDQYDRKDYLSVLLANNSFSEFFDQVKYLEGIQQDIQNTLNRVQELVEKLNTNKDELSDKRDRLSELLNKLEGQKYNLKDQKNTKEYLIAQTKESEQQYQSLIKELQQAQAAANNQIAALERQIREELNKNNKFEDFGEAALNWPTSSRRITAYFHDQSYPFRHLFEHSGLDFGIPQGTSVKAAEGGYVAKVAIGTKWYGNYIMIVHNNNLSTLYAHLSSVNVKEDQYVTKGQQIGLSGNTGFSTGPHLHFEVRSNGIPVNPLNYLP